ncbi:unnamed protein product [Boreogadus saida]
MASSFWKGIVGVGLFALAHAAFSAAQHRSYMRLTEKENEMLPIDRGGAVARIKRTRAITDIGITWGKETAEASDRARTRRGGQPSWRDAVGGDRTNPY